jgi:hypothetical protein
MNHDGGAMPDDEVQHGAIGISRIGGFLVLPEGTRSADCHCGTS